MKQDTRNVEIDLDSNSIRDHLRDFVQNWNSKKAELYFESESLLEIKEPILLKIIVEENIHMYCLELMRFRPPPGRHGRSSENLRMLLNFKVLFSLLIVLELSLQKGLLIHELC